MSWASLSAALAAGAVLLVMPLSFASAQQKAASVQDWSRTVVATPEGGFQMGNPAAPVRVVQYASMTCSHCAEFAAAGAPALVENYVRTGRVSYEVRNFVHNSADIAASLLARCNGPSAFFPLTDQLLAARQQWIGRLQSMSSRQQRRVSKLPPEQQALWLAKAAGLDQFAVARGIPTDKVQQCLTNRNEVDRLVGMVQQASTDHPGLPGTPAFLINGKLVEDASTWEALELELRRALR